jgi:hypothetical protein
MSDFTERGPVPGRVTDDPGVRETDGDNLALDPDANDDLVNSAEADQVAAGAYDDDDDWDDDDGDDEGL